MQIDRIIYPVHSLGPGNRLVIWTIGCNKRCECCSNPELQKPNPGKEMSLGAFKSAIEGIKNDIEGITISGGEPLLQAEELSGWAEYFCEITDDILMFTGFNKEELKSHYYIKKCMEKIPAMVVGEYIESLNDNKSALIGSLNQELIITNPALKERYEIYISKGRMIENFIDNGVLVSTGIHNRGYYNDKVS